MFSTSSLTNTKLQIIKTSIILIISHIVRCNYGDFSCGNIYFQKNLLSILLGFLFFNFIGIKIVKSIKILDYKTFYFVKNMAMYTSILFINYMVFNSLDIYNSLVIVGIMMGYNIFASLLDKNISSSSHKNLSYKRLFLNSVNITLFIILLDNFIFDNNKKITKTKLTSYIVSIIFYLCVKNLI